MPNMLERVRIYTTASRTQDLPTTVCLNDKAGLYADGRTIRLVHVMLEEFGEQVEIYTQHDELSLCANEWREQVQAGNVTALRCVQAVA